MNKIGNILTVLILLMSTIFLVIAVMVAASDRNWKKAASNFQAKAKAAQDNLELVKGSTQKMEKLLVAERTSRAGQVGNLNSQVRILRDQLKTESDKLVKAEGRESTLVTELNVAQKRIEDLVNQINNLKKVNTDYVDDISVQFQSVRNLQNQLYEAQNQITVLNETKSNLEAKVAKFAKVMLKNNLDENSLTDHIPPKVESVVSATFRGGLFEIKLGEDDGVRVGHEMDIFRKRRFVGKGRVVKTNHNNAVLRVIDGMMNDQVQEGDSVSTKL